jgi:hypothetical protein
MELPREFDEWKKNVLPILVPDALPSAPAVASKQRKTLQRATAKLLDRLWYEALFDVVSTGDVYNPGGRSSIPRLYTVGSPIDQTLGELGQFEEFGLTKESYRVDAKAGSTFTRIQGYFGQELFLIPNQTYVIELETRNKITLGDLVVGKRFKPVDRFEVLFKRQGYSVVRNSRGYVSRMPSTVGVRRFSSLARDPDGFSESKVAIASFPVSNTVNHRTMRVNGDRGPTPVRTGKKHETITAFVGDAQSAPHFMRYSGLTGATLNCMNFNNFVAQALHGVSFQDRVKRYSFVTNWSNGEVVERGTGSNYGEDGLLRPGFTYQRLIDYLYGRAMEHRDIGAEPGTLITRDWMKKLAASLVPRGMETDALFQEAVYGQLEAVIRSKFEHEVRKTLDGAELSSELENAISEQMTKLARGWSEDAAPESSVSTSGEPAVSDDNMRAVLEISEVLEAVVTAVVQTIDFSVDLRSRNQRISSELFTQPKPVDSFIDDLAVEAQSFANALTMSVAFGTGAIALGLSDNTNPKIISSLLGVLAIRLSFGTMTNVSRYRNRNEEAQVLFSDEKMLEVMKGVFSLMTRDQRDLFDRKDNPFAQELTRLVDTFFEHARYYGLEETMVKSFNDAYDHLVESINDKDRVLSFMRQLVTEFIPCTFQENSFLQEELVHIYKILSEMLRKLGQPNAAVDGSDTLYESLLAFRPKLQASVQRGEIRYGFLREREWHHWSFILTLQYLFSPLLPKHIAGETREVLDEAKRIRNNSSHHQTLRRETRDLEELFYATTESQIASMIYLSGLIIFVSSILFTTFRLASLGNSTEQWVTELLDITVWGGLSSLFGALLASFHLIRKMIHLFKLDVALGKLSTDPQVRLVRTITRTQEFLTVVRIAANAAACVALPWNLAVGAWGDQISLNSDIPVLIAAGAIAAAVGSTLIFFLVEFVVRYNLDPCLGKVVCEPFRAKILEIKASFSANVGDAEVETVQQLEADAWEYTAREFLSSEGYRFDTVFAADRFGSIVQYLQSGAMGKAS